MASSIRHKDNPIEPRHAGKPGSDGAPPAIPASGVKPDTKPLEEERPMPSFRPRFLPPPDGKEWS